MGDADRLAARILTRLRAVTFWGQRGLRPTETASSAAKIASRANRTVPATLAPILALVLGCHAKGVCKTDSSACQLAGESRSAQPTGDANLHLAAAANWASVPAVKYRSRQTRAAETEAKAIGYEQAQGTVLKVRRASVAPLTASPGKPISFDMDYALLSSEKQLDVSEEWEILRDGKRLTSTFPRIKSRRPGGWRAQASIGLPPGIKPGSYVLRGRVRSGKLTDARDSPFTVVRAAATKRTYEAKTAGKTPVAVDRDLMQVQGQLKELGHDPGSIDGRMSPQTRAALKGFQKDYGLETTGQIDTETRAALGLGGQALP